MKYEDYINNPNKCLNCNKTINHKGKYCSQKCQNEYQYKNYITK